MLRRISCGVLQLFCLLLFDYAEAQIVRGTGTSLQVPIRITRMDKYPDRFATGRNYCRPSGWCTSIFPKAMMVNVMGDGEDCVCQCPQDYPLFQDDVATCVSKIPESAGCPSYSLTGGDDQEMLNPVVQLPPYGQLIGWKINNVAPGQRCWIDESQCRYLAADGWNPLSAIKLGNQPPRFRLVPDVFGSSLLSGALGIKWLGSSEHETFLQGRIILLTLSCNSSGLHPTNLCFPMRIAGHLGRLKSLPLMEAASSNLQQQHVEGEHVETGILVAAACGGALGVLYVIVLAIFVASRLRRNRMVKDLASSRSPEDGEPDIDRVDLERDASAGKAEDGSFTAVRSMEFNASLYTAWPEDVAFRHRLMLRSRGVSSLSMRHLFSPPPFFLNDVLIVQTPTAQSRDADMQDIIQERLQNKLLPKPPVRRRKVLFDPTFLEPHLLKDPPREAETFRAQIHCMINITKSRLDKRKFQPNLETLEEENRAQLSPPRKVMNTPIMSAEPTSHPHCKIKHLDAVELQVVKPEQQPTMVREDVPVKEKSDWNQVLKDEWGSNESLAKIPHRRRIAEVIQTNSNNKSTLKEVRRKEDKPSSSLERQKLKTSQTAVAVKVQSDDEESDKASSRSGSNPEKDSGIEDDSSDKSVKPSTHKSKITADMPALISRKKIVSANVADSSLTKLPGKARPLPGSIQKVAPASY